MEDNRQQEPQIGSPLPTMVFTFTLIVLMIWAVQSGVAGETGTILLGLFQLGCVPGYLAGSVLLFKRGDTLLGNIFLVFTTAFGMIGGLGNFALGIAPLFGISLDPTLANLPLLWSGLVLVAVCVAFRRADIPTLVAFAGGAWTLTTGALMGLGIIPSVLGGINGVVSVLVAVAGFYTALADICTLGGVNVPKGPSIIK